MYPRIFAIAQFLADRRAPSFYLFCFVLLAPMLLAHIVFAAGADESASYIAYVIDVSGSMRAHGFERAKQELVASIQALPDGTRFWIIPFSENEMTPFSGELTEPNRAAVLARAEAFVNSLQTGGRRGDSYGHFTNIDEGINAGKLELLQQPGPGKRSVVMISDGISDPDAYHEPVNIQELGKRIPDSISLYLIDLTGEGGHLPPAWKTSVGSVQGFQVPGSTILLLPCRAEDLTQMLEELPMTAVPVVPATIAPPSRQKAQQTLKEKAHPFWSKRGFWGGLVAVLGTVAIGFLLMRAARRIQERRDQTAVFEREKAQLLHQSGLAQQVEPVLTLTLAGTERQKRFAVTQPMTLQFGTAPGMDFQVTEANHAQISGELRIGDDGQLSLTNKNSTFPFEFDGQQVGNGEEVALPDSAAIQVAKGVVLEALREAKAATRRENRANRLRRYSQRKRENLT